MLTCIQDLAQAARTLVKSRVFTAVCVVSLGLGMSVVVVLFLFNRALVSTPPGVAEDGLVELVVRPEGQLRAQAGSEIVDTWSYPDYLDVRDALGTAVTGWSHGEALIRMPDQARTTSAPAMYVSSNYFSTVGVTLARGRGFTPADDAGHAEPEAVIGHRVWQVRFGSDPEIIGRTVTINRTEFVIVGVAPEGFRGHITGLDEPWYQLWLPLSRHPRLQADAEGPRAGDSGNAAGRNARFDRETGWVRVIARLSSDMTVAQADAIVQSAMAALAERYPASNRDKVGGVEPYFAPGARLRSQVTFGRLMLSGLAGIVLLVVGLNISGMLLVRSAMRERELAVRVAIGASRLRLMRYHLSESLVMAVLGGGFASTLIFVVPAAVAWWSGVWTPMFEILTPDVWVVLQCIVLCFAASLVVGLLPALRFSRPSIISALRNGAGGSQRVGRLQRLTAAAQAGIAVPFLVMCGVQLDQARVTALTDVGFEPSGLYAARVNLAAIARTEDERRLFVRIVQDYLAQAPGVVVASVADGVPLDFRYRNMRVAREGESNFLTVHTTRVAAGYLTAIGTRLVAGRGIETDDREGAERVVVLSEPLARQLFPDADPLGKRLVLAPTDGERETYTVVGVTGDLVSTQMGNPRPQLFLSLAQHPTSTAMFVVRAATPNPSMRDVFEQAIADGLRGIANTTDPALVIRDVLTGEGLIEMSRSDLLTSAAVGGFAAAVALVLAAFGIYGVIAFTVATRTREIGVRIALGASRARVLREVLGDSLRLVVPGIGVGLLLAVLWVRLADPAWYPLGGIEPLVYSLAAAAAFAVAALAGIPSARRAATVEPIVAIRAE